MHAVFLTCLIIGGLYSVVSLVLSGLGGLDFDLDFDFDLDLDFDLGDLTLPIKPFTIMVFLTVFGGVGLILEPLLPGFWAILPAVILGLIAAWALYSLVYVKLMGYEAIAPSEADAIMTRAEVVERIMPGGYGKISFLLGDTTLSGAAKEIKPGDGVAKGAKVYILEVKDNVYYVVEDLEIYLERIRNQQPPGD